MQDNQNEKINNLSLRETEKLEFKKHYATKLLNDVNKTRDILEKNEFLNERVLYSHVHTLSSQLYDTKKLIHSNPLLFAFANLLDFPLLLAINPLIALQKREETLFDRNASNGTHKVLDSHLWKDYNIMIQKKYNAFIYDDKTLPENSRAQIITQSNTIQGPWKPLYTDIRFPEGTPTDLQHRVKDSYLTQQTVFHERYAEKPSISLDELGNHSFECTCNVYPWDFKQGQNSGCKSTYKTPNPPHCIIHCHKGFDGLFHEHMRKWRTLTEKAQLEDSQFSAFQGLYGAIFFILACDLAYYANHLNNFENIPENTPIGRLDSFAQEIYGLRLRDLTFASGNVTKVGTLLAFSLGFRQLLFKVFLEKFLCTLC